MPLAYFFRANFDLPTNYLHYWLSRAISQVQQLGFQTLDSSGIYATKYNFFDSIARYNPEVVIAGGHGDPNTLTGQALEEVLRSCINNEVLSGRYVCAVSCLTGQILGPDSRDKKAHVYTGWTNEFTWIVSPPYDPRTDLAARPFEEVIVKLVVLTCQHQQNLISLADVYNGVRQEFEKWEAYYSIPPGSNDEYASDILLSLRHDKNGLITIGKEEVLFIPGTPPLILAELTLGTIATILPFFL